jgi:hypothetical protein
MLYDFILIGIQQPSLPSQSQYSDPIDRFWNLYLIDADKTDKTLTDGWKGDTDGILIFVRGTLH